MTSVSERCSLAVVQANATLTLYEYISRANRSRPALKVANICVTILLNLSKVSNQAQWRGSLAKPAFSWRSAPLPAKKAGNFEYKYKQHVYMLPHHGDIPIVKST